MTTVKKYLIIFILFFTGGCMNIPLFEDDSKQILILYMARQQAISENTRIENEKNLAVKDFQIQAIKAGFAYWDVVDYTGKVEFKWVGQRRK